MRTMQTSSPKLAASASASSAKQDPNRQRLIWILLEPRPVVNIEPTGHMCAASQ